MKMKSIRILYSKPRNYTSSQSALQIIREEDDNKPISNPIYNFLPKTLNPNNIVTVLSSCLKQKDQIFWSHLHHQGLFSHFTSHELSRVLLRCQSDASTALTFFKWVKNHLNLELNAQNYCILVHILAWSKRYKLSMNLLLELVELNGEDDDVFKSLLSCTDACNWDPVVFDMLVKAYLVKGNVKESFRVYRKIVKVGFVPSVITVNCLLNRLARVDGGVKCWDVYSEMLRIGVEPNACTFNILAHLLCKEGDVDKVNEFLDRAEEEGFDPDIVTYNMLIDGYCKTGRLKDAVYLYNIMYKRGVNPDLITFTALINGLCKGGSVREAHRLFHLMVNRGLKPDVFSYNTLICGYCKEGLMQDARSLLFNMIGSGVCPDSFTCWMLIKGYQSQDRLISALNLVLELTRFGITISRDVYCYLIVALCKDNRPFAAKSLFDQMSHNGYMPSKEIYNELIDSLCRGNFVNEALELKLEMASKTLKPNLSAYRAIIRSLCGLNRSKEAQILMQEMVELGLPPDKEICGILINGLCKEKFFFEAELLLKFFAEEFQIFDGDSYNTILRLLSEEGDPVKSMEYQDRMAKIGFAPSTLSCKYVIDGMWRAMGVQSREQLALMGCLPLIDAEAYKETAPSVVALLELWTHIISSDLHSLLVLPWQARLAIQKKKLSQTTLFQQDYSSPLTGLSFQNHSTLCESHALHLLAIQFPSPSLVQAHLCTL